MSASPPGGRCPATGAHGLNDIALDTRGLLRASLPHLGGFSPTRWAIRAVSRVLGPLVLEVRGAQHVLADRDPYILALNHSQRLEAVAIPTLLALLRGGRLVHFLADWNFMLIPGVALVLRLGGTIPVVRKDAKPRWLNVFKPLYRRRGPALAQAESLLEAGRPIGIFPEGTVNRDPARLLRGHPGAALLALRTGAPVVPAGIRFPLEAVDAPIRDRSSFTIEFGPPLAVARAAGGNPTRAEMHALHDRIMQEIAGLSGKRYVP